MAMAAAIMISAAGTAAMVYMAKQGDKSAKKADEAAKKADEQAKKDRAAALAQQEAYMIATYTGLAISVISLIIFAYMAFGRPS